VVLLIGVPVAGLVVGDAAYRSHQLPTDPSHRFGAGDARITTGMHTTAEVRAALPAGVESLWGAEVSWLPLRTVDQPTRPINTDVSTMDLTQPMARGIARPTEGRLPTGPDEAFVSETLASELGVAVGDELELARPAQRFRIVGIGQASGYGRLLDAPGFDLGVLRPEVVQSVGLVRGELVKAQQLPPLTTDSGDAWVSVEYPETPEVDHVAVFLGWVLCIMLMAVLGIVVAAAFAVSGRRQLVTIGQLSAAGSDPSVLRRYLALQGTWSGAVGVLVGLGSGLVLVPALRGIVASDGRIALPALDLVAVSLIALTTATLAAVVPTRDLARSSTLAALGGRRPLPRVRPRQVQVGAALVALGLLALWVAVRAARDAGGTDAMEPHIILAGAGGSSLLAGMCCVCPVLVDALARIGGRRAGAVRVATRSLGRHRARSAALLAAVAAIGSAAMATGATAEQGLAERRANRWWAGSDVVEVGRTRTPAGQDAGAPPPPVEVDPALTSSVESIVGPLHWVRTRQVVPDDTVTTNALVGDPALLDLLGLDARQRAAVAGADAAVIDPRGHSGWTQPDIRQMLPGLRVVTLADAAIGTRRAWVIVNPTAVERLGLTVQSGSAIARLPGGPTHAEFTGLVRLNLFENDGQYFRDVPSSATNAFINVSYAVPSHDGLVRLAILGGVLLLTTIVVAIGMALSAAEGRDERDALVSLGASPGLLARVVGIKSWLLATAAGVVAVPLGFGTLRLVAAAASTPTRFPWMIAGGIVVLVPLVVGVGATVGSAVAQRARPVRMSTMSPD
jgi:putative ABC transport system permease protein